MGNDEYFTGDFKNQENGTVFMVGCQSGFTLMAPKFHAQSGDNLYLSGIVSDGFGKYLNERLYSAQKEFPVFISEIRGIGLWYAFDVTPVNLTLPLVKEMENRGVIVGSMLNSDGTIRIAPPLVIRPAEIDAFIGVLKASLRVLKKKDREIH